MFHVDLERFAWRARHDRAANVALDAPDEAAPIEGMAQFLWTRRHFPSTDLAEGSS